MSADIISGQDPAKLAVELEKLRRREKLLDASEQLASIGHCEWDFENDCLLSCSPGYARIYGQSIDELMLSQSNWDRVLQQLHPDDRESYTRSYQSQRQNGFHEVEYRVVRPDGTLRHVHETGMVEFDSEGRATAAFGLLQDVTDRKIYQQALENREAMAHQVETIADIGHFIFDLENETYIYISQGFARIHGAEVDEYASMVGSREDDMEDVHPDDYDELSDTYERHRRTGEEFNVEYRIHRSDGEIRWIREQGTSLRSNTGEALQSIGVIQDITRQHHTEQNLREARDTLESMVKNRTRKLADTVKQLKAEIREREKIAAELDFLANHDALTGLPSLRLCKDRLERSLADARRKQQMSAVMFLDLDGFKDINDRHGHEFGDLVLKATADRIQDEIRETDTVARIGGDEFIIILSSLPEVAIAERIAASLIRQIAQTLRVGPAEVQMSASVGIALYPEDGADADALMRAADAAMYRIKHEGKNNYGFSGRSKTGSE